MGWHQLSGPHPEHGEGGRYAKAGREGILMIREKKKFVIKSWRGENFDVKRENKKFAIKSWQGNNFDDENKKK